jgi:hypothetical protein
MKVKPLVPLLAVLLVGAATVSEAAGPRGNSGSQRGSGRNIVAVAPLTAEEAIHLLDLREEEKLAHDVYQELGDRWQALEFRNIVRSEQRHFDAIGSRLVMFGQADPAQASTGTFSKPELQELYNTLMAQGSASYVDALRVGATIEDMDIRDVQAAINATTNPTIIQTYSSLLQASKNHLRSFVSLLATQGVEYEPQYIDEALYDSIVGF